MIDARDLEEGSYGAAVGELAVAQAAMADQGNANAAAALRSTLEDLDELLGLVPPRDGEWFSLLDIQFALTREGIDPRTNVGRALEAAGGLLTYHPPPCWGEGEADAAIRPHVDGPLSFWRPAVVPGKNGSAAGEG